MATVLAGAAGPESGLDTADGGYGPSQLMKPKVYFPTVPLRLSASPCGLGSPASKLLRAV